MQPIFSMRCAIWHTASANVIRTLFSHKEGDAIASPSFHIRGSIVSSSGCLTGFAAFGITLVSLPAIVTDKERRHDEQHRDNDHQPGTNDWHGTYILCEDSCPQVIGS